MYPRSALRQDLWFERHGYFLISQKKIFSWRQSLLVQYSHPSFPLLHFKVCSFVTAKSCFDDSIFVYGFSSDFIEPMQKIYRKYIAEFRLKLNLSQFLTVLYHRISAFLSRVHHIPISIFFLINNLIKTSNHRITSSNQIQFHLFS